MTVGHNLEDDTLLVQAMVQEMIGAMLITFLYLTQTEKDTKMSEDPAITTLIIAATYVAVVGFSEAGSISIGDLTIGVMSGSPFNPAAALGLFWAILFQGNINETKHIWVFFIFSYVGSLLAVVLFECVYKKAMSASNRARNNSCSSEDDEGIGQNQNLLHND